MTIEVANESGVEVDEASLSRLATFVLGRMGVSPLAELSLLLVDVPAMEALHVKWMNEPGPTDVLAFPMDEIDVSRGPQDDELEAGPALLGDVVLCPEVAAKQAVGAGHQTLDELHLLTTHGVLHILGFDHAEPDEAKEMFGLQGELLAAWREASGGGSR